MLWRKHFKRKTSSIPCFCLWRQLKSIRKLPRSPNIWSQFHPTLSCALAKQKCAWEYHLEKRPFAFNMSPTTLNEQFNKKCAVEWHFAKKTLFIVTYKITEQFNNWITAKNSAQFVIFAKCQCPNKIRNLCIRKRQAQMLMKSTQGGGRSTVPWSNENDVNMKIFKLILFFAYLFCREIFSTRKEFIILLILIFCLCLRVGEEKRGKERERNCE